MNDPNQEFKHKHIVAEDHRYKCVCSGCGATGTVLKAAWDKLPKDAQIVCGACGATIVISK